jgi:uncharacterized membrane protein YdjX (TVP38/TMEM64 family)
MQSPITVSWKWLVGAIVLAAVFLGFFGRRLVDVALSIEPYLPGWGPAGVFLYAAIYALTPLLMLPTMPFALGAGILFGFWPGLAAVTIGSGTANAAGFLLSRKYLRAEFERRIEARPKLAAIDRMIEREGWKVVGLLRLTWLHEGLTTYLCGTTSVRFRPYLLISAAALAPGNVMTVYLGTAGVVGYEALVGGDGGRTTAEYVLWGIGAVVAVGASGFIGLKAKRAVEHAASNA